MFLAENWRMRNKFEETKFVFPNAPNIPITVNMGMRYARSLRIREVWKSLTFQQNARVV